MWLKTIAEDHDPVSPMNCFLLFCFVMWVIPAFYNQCLTIIFWTTSGRHWHYTCTKTACPGLPDTSCLCPALAASRSYWALFALTSNIRYSGRYTFVCIYSKHQLAWNCFRVQVERRCARLLCGKQIKWCNLDQ